MEMFAVNHAATALVLKRRFPTVPMTPLLMSVEAVEVVWVVFIFLGSERVSTAVSVHSSADIHLSDMPFCHSVGTVECVPAKSGPAAAHRHRKSFERFLSVHLHLRPGKVPGRPPTCAHQASPDLEGGIRFGTALRSRTSKVDMAIKRNRHGWTTKQNADAYGTVLHEVVISGIEAQSILGCRGFEALKRDQESEVEFVTMITFDSVGNVVEFQGEHYARAYVPDADREVLGRWDTECAHFEVLEPQGGCRS